MLDKLEIADLEDIGHYTTFSLASDALTVEKIKLNKKITIPFSLLGLFIQKLIDPTLPIVYHDGEYSWRVKMNMYWSHIEDQAFFFYVRPTELGPEFIRVKFQIEDRTLLVKTLMEYYDDERNA